MGGARGWASHAWRIAISMVTFLDRRIPWREGIELLEAALHAARSVEDRVGAGYTLNSLGCIHLDQGGWEQARACYEKSVECFREVFNVPGEAMALGNLGLTCSHLGEYEQGQRIGLVALELSRKSGYRRGVAQNLDNLGVACAGAGDHQGTLEYHRRADVMISRNSASGTPPRPACTTWVSPTPRAASTPRPSGASVGPSDSFGPSTASAGRPLRCSRSPAPWAPPAIRNWRRASWLMPRC